jgi:hypothetical protein
VAYIIGAVASIAFFRCCSLYRTLQYTNLVGAVSMLAVPSVAPGVPFAVHRCSRPWICAFALRSARFARTSRCVGVPHASNALYATYGRRVAPTRLQRGAWNANAPARSANAALPWRTDYFFLMLSRMPLCQLDLPIFSSSDSMTTLTASLGSDRNCSRQCGMGRTSPCGLR